MLAWMQNMFTASIPIGWLYMAMAAAVLLLVPFGILFVNWLATLAFGAIELRAPMLFALGAISTLSFGLAGELGHSVIPVNWLLADTTDATAATGYVLVGGSGARRARGALLLVPEDDRPDRWASAWRSSRWC